MVRGEDERGAEPLTEREQPTVTRLPGRRLPGAGAELEPLDFATESETGGKVCHARGYRRALGVNAVVRVRDHELATSGFGPVEQIEKDDGVEAAGDGDERRAARQAEGGEVSAKLVGEIHPGES